VVPLTVGLGNISVVSGCTCVQFWEFQPFTGVAQVTVDRGSECESSGTLYRSSGIKCAVCALLKFQSVENVDTKIFHGYLPMLVGRSL
jgi:hypothetical protein